MKYINPNLSVKELDDEDEMMEESKDKSPDVGIQKKNDWQMKNVKALLPPPLPLLPKSYIMSLDEPARSGCAY
jgi:hypothetical protein